MEGHILLLPIMIIVMLGYAAWYAVIIVWYLVKIILYVIVYFYRLIKGVRGVDLNGYIR